MEERRSPVQIMDDVAAVSVWLSHTMAITTDGGLWAWGNNERGQLGDGTDREQHSPMRIMDDVIAVSAGSGNTLAVRADGSLWFWGNDWIAQPGDEITVTIETPVTFERNQGNSHAFFAFIMLSAIRVAWFVTTIPIILLTLAALGGIVLLIRYLRRRK
ncbi:MAG: hypothetical protein FWC72_07935 [Oscillospiraceae bacterium]|nr:hypothetical protein [Oscillospiraceae bacterium]